MGRAFRCRAGGIAALLSQSRESWEAIEADLLPMGWTLADVPHRFGWRPLLAYLRHAPRESAVYRVAFGAPAKWGDLEYLTALVVDYLAVQVWMNSEDGHKKRNRPKPVPRPGAAANVRRRPAPSCRARPDSYAGAAKSHSRSKGW